MTLALPHNQSSPQHFVFAGKVLVRVIDRDGEAWFVAADVCAALDIVNVSQVVARLDEDERGISTAYTPPMLIVNEAGLYTLILTSRKPEAKAFKRWITHDVLPAIRKTGQYSMSPLSPAQALLASVQQLVDHEQRIEHLEAITLSNTEYYAVVGYYRLRKLGSLTKQEAAAVGRRTAKLSRQRGVTIKDLPNSEHGTVHAYHYTILDDVIAGLDQ